MYKRPTFSYNLPYESYEQSQVIELKDYTWQMFSEQGQTVPTQDPLLGAPEPSK